MASTQAPSPLAAGTVVGGRFVLGEVSSQDAIGWIHAARDQKTHKPIALRLIPASRLGPEGQKALRAECRIAAGLAHRNIVATYGVGTHEGATVFVATEWVDGTSLSDLVKARAGEGRQMSLRGSYNVLAHVCKALSYAQAKTCHGALRPSTVSVDGSGRVKIGEFGLAKTVLATLGPTALGESEMVWLAPEVKAGQPPDDRSDIFGLGAVLYQLLTGRSPAEGFVPPSQAHPDATAAVDEILLRCLAPDGASRFAAPDDVRTALLPLVADAPEVAPEEEFGVGVDIDIDLASMRPPPPAGAAVSPAVPPPPATPGGSAPRVGTRVSLDESFRATDDGGPPPEARGSIASVDLASVLTRITENDAPRWMITKDGLDHGPFSGRELVSLLAKGEYGRKESLLNMDTGTRTEVGEHPDFVEFAVQYEMKQREEQDAAATAVAVKAEARSGVFKATVALGIIAAMLLAGGIFFMTRQARREEEVADVQLDDLYQAGEIEISGTAGILPTPRRGRHRTRGGGGGGAAGSYEEAMNRAVDMGDVTGGGSESVLSPAQVAQVMNRHIGRVYSACVPAEQRRGGNLGRVQLDIAIQGDGRVMGTSARQGSSEFKACIARAVRGVRFPSFGAPRMGARYTFAVD